MAMSRNEVSENSERTESGSSSGLIVKNVLFWGSIAVSLFALEQIIAWAFF